VLDNLIRKPSRYAVPTTPVLTDLVTLVCDHVLMTQTYTAYQSARIKFAGKPSRGRRLSQVTSWEVPLWQSHDEAQANARAKTTHCWRKPFCYFDLMVWRMLYHRMLRPVRSCESERKYSMDTNATYVLD